MSGDMNLCDRCGEPEPLGARADLSDPSHCSEFDAICSDCLLVHGPDACKHDETGTETETTANSVGFQTATGWGTNDRRVPDDGDDVDRTPL